MTVNTRIEIDTNGTNNILSFIDSNGYTLFAVGHNGEAVTVSINGGAVVVMETPDAVQLRDWLNDALLDAE